MSRPLTLGELLEAVNRQAVDPNSVTFTIDGEPITAWSFDYNIVHQPGGPVVEFKTGDDEIGQMWSGPSVTQ